MIKFFMSLALPPIRGFRRPRQTGAGRAAGGDRHAGADDDRSCSRAVPRKTLLLRRPAAGAAIRGGCCWPWRCIRLYVLQRDRDAALSAQSAVGRSSCPSCSRNAPESAGNAAVVMAVVPAICEELAFRGFILSGLRHMGHKWRAIIVEQHVFRRHACRSSSSRSWPVCWALVIGYLPCKPAACCPACCSTSLHNSLIAVARR